MRAALWLLGLFGAAVAVALFAGNNQGTVTLFWPPYRVDFSLNMVVLLLVGGFVTLHAAFAGLNALLTLPRQAARWLFGGLAIVIEAVSAVCNCDRSGFGLIDSRSCASTAARCTPALQDASSPEADDSRTTPSADGPNVPA